MTRLLAEHITLSYGGPGVIIDDLSVAVPDGAVTSIIGPNGCGKSTLLRALARMMTPRAGAVVLDGEAIHRHPTKDVARRLCLMPQQPDAPESITVEDLVRRGRYPHQAMFQPPSGKDEQAVRHALDLAGMTDLRDRPVDELSGGQRQRAWIAMALAQETPLLLLDEPTTYLDIAHQQEIFDLVQRLNQEEKRTIVLVLHDINNAAQISDHIIAMRAGKILAKGEPQTVLTAGLLEDVFGVICDRVAHPNVEQPLSVPRSTCDFSEICSCETGCAALNARQVTTGYGRKRVVENMDLAIPQRKITAIVGPNACGKSTMLRTFARLLKPMDGMAYLEEQPIAEGSHRDFARRLSVLAQGAVSPDGVLVEDLVAVGRYPYQRWWRQWSADDQEALERALSVTGIEDLRWRSVETLSGGQRQRVWLAMSLAQQTEVLLLDEPTTFLDIAHQVETLDLVWEMNRREGRTIVMVLHDLGQACRYADYLVVMKNGQVVATGNPNEIINANLIQEVFDIQSSIGRDPITGGPLIMPTRNSIRQNLPEMIR